jgi:hypothetical protein
MLATTGISDGNCGFVFCEEAVALLVELTLEVQVEFVFGEKNTGPEIQGSVTNQALCGILISCLLRLDILGLLLFLGLDRDDCGELAAELET